MINNLIICFILISYIPTMFFIMNWLNNRPKKDRLYKCSRGHKMSYNPYNFPCQKCFDLDML